MDDTNVCTPLAAESDASNNTSSPPNAASVTDADKVINTKSDNPQVKGDINEAELLKGLLTDTYCHLCEAVLCFESQRLSHYEGKKHAQKLKVYLQAKRAEMNKDSPGTQRNMSTDRDRFCELCNMVFSSNVVANSHYGGKVHSKNLRKQGLHPRDRCAEVQLLPSPSQDADHSEQKSPPEAGMQHPADPPAAATAPPTAEVDPNDSSKYCALCSASFNNPQTALQHYNGRKHQRKQARQCLLQDLEMDDEQGNALMCQMCNVQFTSVEMYQAHMQGNKHQIREKKVADLCNSQQKVYGTFADELADYIQVQKARGITPKASQAVRQGAAKKEEEDELQEGSNTGNVMEMNHPNRSLPPNCRPPHQSHPGFYYPAEMWPSSYQGPPPWPPHGQDYNYPPPPLPSHFRSQPVKRRKLRNDSSSSSYTASSSSPSSYSSSTSESEDSEHRCKEKKKTVRSRRDRDAGRGKRDVGSDRDERRKPRKRVRDYDSEERKRERSAESDERRRSTPQNHGKHRRKEKKFLDENSEVERDQRAMDKLKPEDTAENRKQTELLEETSVEASGQNEPSMAKYRKEKKKRTKEREDTRTEEEKLWDDSILGC